MKKIIFLLLTTLFLNACSHFTQNTGNLYSTYWVIEEVGKADKFFTLNKKEKRANGFLGCNIFNAEVSVNAKKQTITFNKIVTTKRICVSGAKSKAEQEMLNILQSTAKYSIAEDNSTLVLKDKSGIELMTFKSFQDESFRQQ